MQEQGFAELDAELELRDEPFLLVGMRRVVAVEIEPAFADRHDPWVAGDAPYFGNRGWAAIARVMRMNAGSRIKIEARGDFQSRAALLPGGARYHDGRDAGIARVRDDLVEIGAERGVRQVGPDVDHSSFFSR